MSEVRLCASDEVREFSTVSHRTHHLSASLLLQKSRAGHGHFRIQVDLIVRECWVLSFDVLRYTADCFWKNAPMTIASNRWRAVAKNRPCGMMINSPCALLKPPMVFRESGSRDEFSACHSAHSSETGNGSTGSCKMLIAGRLPVANRDLATTARSRVMAAPHF